MHNTLLSWNGVKSLVQLYPYYEISYWNIPLQNILPKLSLVLCNTFVPQDISKEIINP